MLITLTTLRVLLSICVAQRLSGDIPIESVRVASQLGRDLYCMTSENPLLVVLEGSKFREGLKYIPTGRNNGYNTMTYLQCDEIVPCLLDASSQREAVAYKGNELDKVDERRDAVQDTKLLVEGTHLIRLCILVIPLLSVSLGLSTAVLHGLDSGGKQHGKLGEAADKHDCDGHQGAPLVGSLKQAADATFDAQEGVSGECQSEERGDCGLHAKVDGEQFALDGGEGRPVDGSEHDDAIDEGMKEGRSQQGAV